MKKYIALLFALGVFMSVPHASVASNLATNPKLSVIAEFLEKWYQGWDRVYLGKKSPEACDALSQMMVEQGGSVAFPSKSVTTRPEFLAFLQQIQTTDVLDRHELEGFKVLSPMRVQAFIHFSRTAPIQLDLHTRVEIELEYQGSELRVKTYKPAFSMAEPAIRSMMDAYLAAFQELDVEKTRKYYALPVALVTPAGVVAFQTDEQVRGFLSTVFNQLRAQNYVRSAWKEVNVFPLSPTTAFVSTVLERYDAEGRVIENSGASYQLVLKDGQWLIGVGGANASSFVIR